MCAGVILFGTGSGSDKVKHILNLEDNQLIGYADNNIKRQGTCIDNIYVYKPDQLIDLIFDYIIIGSMYFDEIYTQLIKLGIPKSKIINIYEYIRYNDVRLTLHTSENKLFDTLITGISYARYGYDTTVLCKPSLNMSFNSQDIFYDYCLARYLLEHDYTFKNAFVSLAYYSFQFDLSLSREKHLVNRYEVLIDVQKHVNKEKFNKVIYPLIKQKEQTKLPLNLFIENFVSEFDELHQSDRILGDLTQDRQKLAQLHSNKNYPKTVIENKMLFEKYLVLLIQHNIKPIIVIHPQEQVYRLAFDEKIIKEFNEIIDEFKAKYPITVVDLFADSRFNKEDFYDVHHLNKQGAKKVSKIMNDYLGE